MTRQSERPEPANAALTTAGSAPVPNAVRHVVVGAGGGQGTSTVAVALAALSARHHPTTLATHDRDALCALVGLASDPPGGPVELAPGLTLSEGSSTGGSVSVVDAGSLRRLREQPTEAVPASVDERRWLVLRGPCYLSLRAAVTHPWRPHGVELLSEPRRALSARDVADVLGAPVVAEILQDHRVARAIDAGTFLACVSRLDALADLKTLVPPSGLERSAPDPSGPNRDAARRMSDRLDHLQHPSPGIDLPLER